VSKVLRVTFSSVKTSAMVSSVLAQVGGLAAHRSVIPLAAVPEDADRLAGAGEVPARGHRLQ
jgi:hypothetical protein